MFHGAPCMSAPVDLQDGQALKTQNVRESLKSKVFFLSREKSFGIHSLATYCYYMLEMAMTKSKRIEHRRRGSFFSDANVFVCVVSCLYDFL